MQRREVPLGDVCKVDSGPAFKSAGFLDGEDGIRLLRGENIEPGSLRWNRTKSWPPSLMNGYEHLLVQEGDLILGMDRPLVSAGLKLARVRLEDCPALLVQRVARLRPSEVDGSYLYHWLSEPRFARHLQVTASGTQLPYITLRSIREFAIPRFGPDRERRIVEILEDHLSSLDSAEAELRQASRRLEALWAVALDRSITGPSVRLGDVALEPGYGTSTKCVVDGSGLPVARIPNLVRGRLDMSDEKRAADPDVDLNSLLLRRDDLLIIRTNGSRDLIGRAALVEQDAQIAFASYLIRYRLDSTRILPKWALAALKSPRVRESLEAAAASSAGQHNLSIAKLDAVEMPCPGLVKQTDALARLGVLNDQIQRLDRTIDVVRRKLGVLRRVVLAAAFEGKLTGKHTDCGVIEELAGA